MLKQTVQFFCTLIVLLFAVTASATSIQKVDFATLADMSAFIFEGEVMSSEPRWNAAHNRIHTYVTFRVDDVVKGELGDQVLELRFAGGALDGQNFTYQGLVYPKVGEQGIYFVETLTQYLVNPLVGWSQGHFKVDDSQMITNENKPVVAVQAARKSKAGELSEGVAGGMLVGSDADQGMSTVKFKAQIKAVLGNRK